jgi:hypothetical protein
MTRSWIVALFAVLLGVQVVRNAVVSAFAESAPSAAERVWRSHPDVETSSALIAIAKAARERQRAAPAVFAKIRVAASMAPLAADPYLVRGVQAQLSGNLSLAEQAFLAASWRDGRSLPARYFLADLYFRKGDARNGLREVGVLARLAPNGAQTVAPYIAAYAANRSNWPQLRALFRSEPWLEEPALVALANDAKNADTILALSNPQRRRPDSPWLAGLLASLNGSGQYAKARQVWAMMSRVQLDQNSLIYDPQFVRSEAPPPFNWLLASSTLGLAERQQGGGLHVLYYGQEDGVLAEQLLTLAAGRYRFSSEIMGSPTNAASFEWVLQCHGTNAPIASAGLDAASHGLRFEVPAACRGQRLELVGTSSDMPQQGEVRIRSVNLVAERPNG